MNANGKFFKTIIILTAAVLIVTFSGCQMSGGSGGGQSSNSPESKTVSKNVELDVEQPVHGDSLYVTGVEENVSLRNSDDDSGDILASPKIGEEVKLINGESMTCYYVDYNGEKGYIKKEYLTKEKNAACIRECGYISKNTSLYDESNGSFFQILNINKNDKIYVMAKTSGNYWYIYHESSDQYGYVEHKFISDEPSVTALPSVAASSAPASTAKDEHYIGSGSAPANYSLYTVKGVNKYLALRNQKAFDGNNEIGKMLENEEVYVVDTSTGLYWYVYSPKLKLYGYANSDYLSVGKNSAASKPGVGQKEYPVGGPAEDSGKYYSKYYVSGVDKYLAIRSEQSYNTANELGKIYEGELVYVIDKNTGSEYWYCYSPTTKMYGFANSKYLSTSAPTVSSSDNYTVYTVTGTTNYLGLRSEPKFDESNILAKLNNGDKVHVYSTAASGDYWYVYSPTYNVSGYVNYKYLKK